MHAEQVTPFTPPTAVAGQPASYSGAVNAFILAGHALVDGGQAINAEMLAFWQSRLKEALPQDSACWSAARPKTRGRSSWNTPSRPSRRTSISRPKSLA